MKLLSKTKCGGRESTRMGIGRLGFALCSESHLNLGLSPGGAGPRPPVGPSHNHGRPRGPGT